MKESFSGSKQPDPEKVKIADDTGEMFEWEVSHHDDESDMVYLKQFYDSGEGAKFVYRGMSRARYVELSGKDPDPNMENSDPVNIGTIKTPELRVEKFQKPFTPQETWKLLSYADIRDDGLSDVEYLAEEPNAPKYSGELIKLSMKHGQNEVMKFSDEVRADYKKVMDDLGFDLSPYSVGSSVSWSIEGLAEQSRHTWHPEESGGNYADDPFDPRYRNASIRAISSRHIGWEFQSAMNSSAKKAVENLRDEDQKSVEGHAIQSEAMTSFVTNVTPDKVEQIIEAIGNNGVLSPQEYEKLGELLRPDIKDGEVAIAAGVKSYEDDPVGSLKADREALYVIGGNNKLKDAEKHELLEKRLDSYFDKIVKLDQSTYAETGAGKIYDGLPSYVPDGFMDMGTLSETSPSKRGGRPINYVDKRAVLEKYKYMFIDVYTRNYKHKSEAQRQGLAALSVAHEVYKNIPYARSESSKPGPAERGGVYPLSTVETGVCQQQALTSQVLLQALGVESRLVKTAAAFKKDIEKHGLLKAYGGDHVNNFVKLGESWYIFDATNPQYKYDKRMSEKKWEAAIFQITEAPEVPKSSRPRDNQTFVVETKNGPRKYMTRKNSYWKIKHSE